MVENEEDRPKIEAEIREKQLALAAQFGEEADEANSDEDPFYDDRGKKTELEWDCETIVSTYTNTDNHPGVIKTTKRIRPAQKMKIELHKAFRVPIDGLTPIAEEIVI